jgi:hypothetical protein
MVVVAKMLLGTTIVSAISSPYVALGQRALQTHLTTPRALAASPPLTPKQQRRQEDKIRLRQAWCAGVARDLIYLRVPKAGSTAMIEILSAVRILHTQF